MRHKGNAIDDKNTTSSRESLRVLVVDDYPDAAESTAALCAFLAMM